MPVPSVHREVDRAQSAGLVTSRKIGNTRLVRANTDSPYYAGLVDILVKAFGPPAVLGQALSGVVGIVRALIYGSWAARSAEEQGQRPIGDIDVLLLGSPDRGAVFAAVSRAESRLGRSVQVTFRPSGWLATGTGSFHANLTDRPVAEIPLATDQIAEVAESR